MKPSILPRIKICCIKNIRESEMAVRYGASAIGLVGKMPSGPGVIRNSEIKRIASCAPPGISTFLLTSETDPDGIIGHHKKVNTSVIQIVDRVPVSAIKKIRRALPSVKIVQVIHVIDESSVEEAVMYSEFSNALLLDSGNPNLKVKELGGTGRKHDWNLSAKIRKTVDVPIYLAGGLNPGNVAEAVIKVRPFGLDLCSGVRTGGNLDEKKLKAFFESVKNTAKY